MNNTLYHDEQVLFEHQPYVGINPPPPIFRVMKKVNGNIFVEYNFERGELHFEGEDETLEAALAKLLLALEESEGFERIHKSQYLWLRKQLISLKLLEEMQNG